MGELTLCLEIAEMRSEIKHLGKNTTQNHWECFQFVLPGATSFCLLALLLLGVLGVGRRVRRPVVHHLSVIHHHHLPVGVVGRISLSRT